MSKKNEIKMQKIQTIGIKQLINQIQLTSPFIKLKQSGNKNIASSIERPLGYNIHFDVDENLFSLDLDELNGLFGEKYVLDSVELLYDKFSFNYSEAIYSYPYPLVHYWDIMAYPPIKNINHDLRYYSQHYSKKVDEDHEILSLDFNRELNSLTQTDVTFQNEVKLILNGDFFDIKLKLIKSAKKFVLASNMFLTGDFTQESLYKLLGEKVKEGIPVYFILDKVFALKYNKAFKRLEELGVKVFYLDNGFKLKNRTIYHTKFWVFDDADAIVYGANLIDAQIVSNGFNGGYRDSGISIKGPAVTDLISLFTEIASNFNSKAHDLLAEIKSENEKRKKVETVLKVRGIENFGQKGMMRVVFQGQFSSQTNISFLYKALIEKAKSHLYLNNVRLTEKFDKQNDYYTALITQLMLDKANKENVRIDLLTNNYLTATDVKSVNYKKSGIFTWLYKFFVKRENMRIVANANRKYFREKNTNKKFKIWHYFQFIHAKVLSIDNVVNVFGSFNLNKLSTDSSYEIAVLCYGDMLGDEVNEMIVRDLLNSVPILRGDDSEDDG